MDWWCHNGLRADKLDRELLRLMRKAGCSSIAIGIESGDENIFNSINKGEKLSDIIRAVRMIKKAGIRCVGYFIIGLPGESIESVKKTIRLQRKLNLSDFKYNMLVPYPGTAMWDIIHREGRMLTDVKNIYHFGNNSSVSFETHQIKQDLIDKCYYLAHNQGWIPGEKYLRGIKDAFKSRYQVDSNRIVVIENKNSSISKFISSEFCDANIIKICQEIIPTGTFSEYELHKTTQYSYFDALLQTAQSASEIVADIPKKKLFIKNNSSLKAEYIRNEILPNPLEWDGSSRAYFACRLKHNSPASQSAKNGIIYKDNIALPFSPMPQSVKGQCGKIEDGLAFISIAAYSENSIYTADYLSLRSEFDLQEVIIKNNDVTALERIVSEADILFCPEKLKYLALMVSRAKMNAVYFSSVEKNTPMHYRLADYSLPRFMLVTKKIKALLMNRYSPIRGMSRQLIILVRKIFICFSLWVEILFLLSLRKSRNFLFRKVGF
jgi:hypothetical protein